MALNIGGAGEYRDILKYNAQLARWYLRSGSDESEIESPKMVMDLANIATGWVLFLEGSAPNRRWDPSLEVEAPRPSENHRRGFSVLCFSTKYFNGLAELSSGSMHISNAIKELYAEFEESRGEHPGQLPVVACTDTTAMKDKFGTNHKPTLQIADWADRPEDLPDVSPADPSEIWTVNDGAASPPPRPRPADYVSDGAAKPADDKPASELGSLF